MPKLKTHKGAKSRFSYLANPVGNQSLYSGPVSGMQLYFTVEELFYPLGLAPAQVALGAFNPHNLSAAGNMEAAFRAFMCFQIWHLVFPLSLLWLSL